jgi:hypothetical protein
MKVKNGDIIEFLAISWDEQWEFDHPTVVLQPAIDYSPNGASCESMIEDMAIDFCCNEDVTDEDISEEFKWRGWKLSTLKKVAKERLEGKPTWKTKIREVVKQKIQFYEKDGELEFKVIETIEA